ncbi:MAG: carbonic anhydrase, partial [Desulfobulbia bacterium]
LSRTSGQNADQQQQALEYLSIKQSLKNLQTFSFVEDPLSTGRLTLYGAWFSISDAELRWLDNETSSFDSIDSMV